MSAKFHFISGLPRSGSTLLSSILRQNPAFTANISSPVAPMLTSILQQFSAGSEHASQVSTMQRQALCKGLFENYYTEQQDKQVIFDTNRLWCARLPLLQQLFPQSKVIACVRNVAWIMDSIERLYNKDPLENSRLFNDDAERNTVYSRTEALANTNRMVGFAWTALKEAYYSPHAKSVLLVDYQLLTEAPDKVMRLIYQFIDEPWFEHDFNNLSFDTPQFDQNLGLSGLHSIRPKLAVTARQTVLPPDVFERFNTMNFWDTDTSSAANVIRIKQP
ncbi:sulfotransferase family protein [Bowmanella yangjiangensis]|uniref:Sulfotransferase n=1 Tax=Bowmanella yangjiangensis TaxID=2811230 RepID=A0ABS3CNS8_9ALTE|nr:sulfotransferase [Bowmanella yangjiangensis]MBN7818751.1 sulfotransferase [Bowmanella yangjiangensis]